MSRVSRIPSNGYVKEKVVLEPEMNCEGHVKRSQSGRELEEANFSKLSILKKCRSVDGTSKKAKINDVRRLKTRSLKVPRVPERIVNIVNILQHEKFLDMVDQFFKPNSKKLSRIKKPQSKTSDMNKSLDCGTEVHMSTICENTLDRANHRFARTESKFALGVVVDDRRVRGSPFFLECQFFLLGSALQPLDASVVFLDFLQGSALCFWEDEVEENATGEIDQGVKEKSSWHGHSVDHVEVHFVRDGVEDVAYGASDSCCAASYLGQS
ncbi:unnamed protein product [Heterotrigona itama]|uniref:Uncharacterized protein n=1 Tax=Heterotrigona itama TaxID=395501 RepID=A0A6V7GY59_9HYME|nr:unnamed protein product [Heterotrigona itama]